MLPEFDNFAPRPRKKWETQCLFAPIIHTPMNRSINNTILLQESREGFLASIKKNIRLSDLRIIGIFHAYGQWDRVSNNLHPNYA